MNRLIFTRKTHRILAWFVGLQVIIWMLSGLVMSLFEIQTVRGSHLFVEQPAQSLSAQEIQSLPDKLAALGIEDRMLNISVIQIKDDRYYRLQALNQPFNQGFEQAYLVSVDSGRLLVLDEAIVTDVFNDSYQGKAKIVHVHLMAQELPEIRGRSLPIWQITLSDGAHIYIDPDSAQISAVRTRWWRVFDFFWMLHIMDYDAREDTSHPLLILAALSGLILAISGMLMLVLRQLKKKKIKRAS